MSKHTKEESFIKGLKEKAVKTALAGTTATFLACSDGLPNAPDPNENTQTPGTELSSSSHGLPNDNNIDIWGDPTPQDTTKITVNPSSSSSLLQGFSSSQFEIDPSSSSFAQDTINVDIGPDKRHVYNQNRHPNFACSGEVMHKMFEFKTNPSNRSII